MFNVSLQAQWFCELLQQGDAAEAFNVIPASVVKDMASWLSFCIRMGRAGGTSIMFLASYFMSLVIIYA